MGREYEKRNTGTDHLYQVAAILLLSSQNHPRLSDHRKARGIFCVRLDAEDEKDRKSSYEPLILWELDEKGNRKREPLFAWYPQETIISCQDGYREAEITVLSGTILLDKQKRNRAFQSPDQAILEIADQIIKDTDHAVFILNGPDRDAGGTAIPYQEIDWQF